MEAYVYMRKDGTMTAVILAEHNDHAAARFEQELPRVGFPNEIINPDDLGAVGINNVLVLQDRPDKATIKRARERFGHMKARAAMYARYKEAFLAEVTGIMAVLDPKFEVTDFNRKHCRTDPKDSEIDTVWCAAVIDDVLGLPMFEEE